MNESWTEVDEIKEEHLEIKENDSELVRTGKNLIKYMMEHKEDDIGTDPHEEYVKGWVEGIDQLVIEIEGPKNQCSFCKSSADCYTPDARPICNSCGDEMIKAYEKKE